MKPAPRLNGFLVIGALSVLLTAPSAFAGDDPPKRVVPKAGQEPSDQAIRICTTIYEIRTDLSGNTSLTEDIGARDAADQVTARPSSKLSLFTVADLRIGTSTLRMSPEDGLTWDGEEAGRPREPGVRPMAAPQLMVLPGQEASIFIGSEQAITYMEHVEDNQYELKRSSHQLGMNLTLTAEPQKDGRIRLDGFDLSLKAMTGREPDPSGLHIGKPQIAGDRIRLTLTVHPGRDYGILYTTENRGMLLIIVNIDRPGQAPAEGAPAEG